MWKQVDFISAVEVVEEADKLIEPLYVLQWRKHEGRYRYREEKVSVKNATMANSGIAFKFVWDFTFPCMTYCANICRPNTSF